MKNHMIESDMLYFTTAHYWAVMKSLAFLPMLGEELIWPLLHKKDIEKIGENLKTATCQ